MFWRIACYHRGTQGSHQIRWHWLKTPIINRALQYTTNASLIWKLPHLENETTWHSLQHKKSQSRWCFILLLCPTFSSAFYGSCTLERQNDIDLVSGKWWTNQFPFKGELYPKKWTIFKIKVRRNNFQTYSSHVAVHRPYANLAAAN